MEEELQEYSLRNYLVKARNKRATYLDWAPTQGSKDSGGHSFCNATGQNVISTVNGLRQRVSLCTLKHPRLPYSRKLPELTNVPRDIPHTSLIFAGLYFFLLSLLSLWGGDPGRTTGNEILWFYLLIFYFYKLLKLFILFVNWLI